MCIVVVISFLFGSNYLICEFELSEALNLLNCGRKKDIFSFAFIDRFVTHSLLLHHNS